MELTWEWVGGEACLAEKVVRKKNNSTNRGYKPLASISLRHWSIFTPTLLLEGSCKHSLKAFKKRIDVVNMSNDVEEGIAIAL